jgi:hypothetical protein
MHEPMSLPVAQATRPPSSYPSQTRLSWGTKVSRAVAVDRLEKSGEASKALRPSAKYVTVVVPDLSLG